MVAWVKPSAPGVEPVTSSVREHAEAASNLTNWASQTDQDFYLKTKTFFQVLEAPRDQDRPRDYSTAP